jgi:hypothetical protein
LQEKNLSFPALPWGCPFCYLVGRLYLYTKINLDISSCMLGAAILYSCAALNNIGGKSCSDSLLLGNDIKVYIYMLSVLPTGV